jgi:hypothetical protein
MKDAMNAPLAAYSATEITLPEPDDTIDTSIIARPLLEREEVL